MPGGVRLFHIGSTAIPGIWAKPIIDILAEAPLDEHQRITELLLARGYAVMSQSQGRVSLNKGYTPEGFAKRVFHLHLRQPGDYNELYFRDYLTEHPETAKEYERLKLALWKQFEHNRDEYTARKTVFIQKYTQLAVAQYGKDRFK